MRRRVPSPQSDRSRCRDGGANPLRRSTYFLVSQLKGPGGDMTAIEIKGTAIVPFFVNAADDIYIGWPTNEIA